MQLSRKVPADLDVSLIHRVLLTDPAHYSSLSLTTQMDETPSFEQFVQSMNVRQLSTNGDVVQMDAPTLVANSLKGAYRDRLVQNAQKSMDPLQNHVLQLHTSIRQLIPSRTDLHKFLNDESIGKATTTAQLLELIKLAGKALSQLESEARTETTVAWIQSEHAQTTEFIVNSILYLLFKTELCAMDKQNFYLSHVWAPQIQLNGTQLEQAAFEQQFGSLNSQSTAPLTREWIRSLVNDQNATQLLQVPGAGKELIYQAWIREIVFRKKPGTLKLPEIFRLDADRMESVRAVTRLAAAGSALALYASQVAGQPSRVLEQPIASATSLNMRRVAMVQALTEQYKPDYEQQAATAVISLAQEWKPSLKKAAIDLLTNRTIQVLRGQDPVISVLEGRILDVFASLVTTMSNTISAPAAPIRLRTGRVTIQDVDAWEENALQVIAKRGLSFYASDLTMAARMSLRIVELAYGSFGTLLDRLIVEECKRQLQQHQHHSSSART